MKSKIFAHAKIMLFLLVVDVEKHYYFIILREY